MIIKKLSNRGLILLRCIQNYFQTAYENPKLFPKIIIKILQDLSFANLQNLWYMWGIRWKSWVVKLCIQRSNTWRKMVLMLTFATLHLKSSLLPIFLVSNDLQNFYVNRWFYKTVPMWIYENSFVKCRIFKKGAYQSLGRNWTLLTLETVVLMRPRHRYLVSQWLTRLHPWPLLTHLCHHYW